MSKSEKYGLIGIVGVLIIVLIISAFVKSDGGNSKSTRKGLSNDPDVILSNAQEESEEISEKEMGEFTEINIDQYMEMYNGSEKKLILIARPTCGYCQVAEPILQKLIKDYKLTIHYLDTDELDETAQETLINSHDSFKEGLGTPTLLVVSGGTVNDTVDGLTDTAHYEKFFKDNGFIE